MASPRQSEVPVHLDVDPQPASVRTDASGYVLTATSEAAVLLNMAPRGLQGRNLLVFLGADRLRFVAALALAGGGLPSPPMSATVLPRGRRARSVVVTLQHCAEGHVEWRFATLPTEHQQS